jgi:hypothetical protein
MNWSPACCTSPHATSDVVVVALGLLSTTTSFAPALGVAVRVKAKSTRCAAVTGAATVLVGLFDATGLK